MRPVWIFLVILGLGAGAAAGQDVVEQAWQDVAVLTSPEMKGRGYTFDGHRKAAQYLRRQFEALGLLPPEGGYEQPFELKATLFPEAPVLEVDGERLRPGRDYLPYPGSAAGTVWSRAVVAAGQGLVLPQKDLDAYGGRRVDGAVVVLQGEVPEAIRADTTLPPAALSREARIEVATRLGAAAVILLVERLMQRTVSYHARIPVLEVEAAAWPEQAEHVFLEVTALQDRPVTSQNVIGLLPGTAYPDSTILLIAHYDHHGALGEHVYFPGANDNASGVALLLSLARYFKAHPLRYTLVFVAFSGEEVGLVGSRHFAEHPVVDLSKTRFLLNFDMVASGETGVMAVGGVDFPAEYAVLDRLNTSLGRGPLGRRANAPNSDHYFILQKGVRGFYLYTRDGRQPYHHVEDVAETLEWEDFMHVYELARRFLEAL